MKFQIRKLFALPRSAKVMLQMFLDIVLISVCVQSSFFLRTETFANFTFIDGLQVVALTAVASVILFASIGLYKSVIRYIARDASTIVLVSACSSAAFFAGSCFVFNVALPRSVPIIYVFLLMLMMGGSRLVVRNVYQKIMPDQRTRVAIYGAGEAGKQLAMGLSQNLKYRLIAYIDDNPKLINMRIAGTRVVSRSTAIEVVKNSKVEKVFLALPNATKDQKSSIIEAFKDLNVVLEVIPALEDILEGRLTITNTRPIQIEDILGRAPVVPDSYLMKKNSSSKTILVTGSGGSIGGELCRQLLKQNPKKIVLLDSSEFALYQIHRDLNASIIEAGLDVELTTVLASIQNVDALDSIFETYRFDTVFHAAAYKHVPLVEFNIVEGIKNNVFGTLNVARACCRYGVRSFTLISTDKAVRPTNVMGASKRVAELICQSLAEMKSHQTTISMVRFGNVLGSSGSVIPQFQAQIAAGGPVTVTDPKITRYFMSIAEAAQLVVQASSLAKGGEVFLLDMGEPVNILDIAKHMIGLSGATPKIQEADSPEILSRRKSIPIVFTGLRPGEKLYEELLVSENSQQTDHPRILCEKENLLSDRDLETLLSKVWSAAQENNVEELIQLLSIPEIGFKKSDDIVDNIWTNKAPSNVKSVFSFYQEEGTLLSNDMLFEKQKKSARAKDANFAQEIAGE